MRTKPLCRSAVVAVCALSVAACSPGAVDDIATPSTTSSVTAPGSSRLGALPTIEQIKDLVVGTWLRTEQPNEFKDLYRADGSTRRIGPSGAAVGAGTWEVVDAEVGGGTFPVLRTVGEPRTAMVVAAIDWRAMILSIPGRGTDYHYTRIGGTPLAGWYGGRWRGLTVRADGTGTGYFKTLCDDTGGNCVNNVYYDFVLASTVTGLSAARTITAARPASALPLLKPDTLTLDVNADIITSGGSETFCGERARPFACGA